MNGSSVPVVPLVLAIVAFSVALPVVIVTLVLRVVRGDTASIANGVPSSAVIQSIAATGTSVTTRSVGSRAPVCKMELLVTPPGGGEPYPAACKRAVPLLALAMVTPGSTIRVLVDPVNPQNVVPDWQNLRVLGGVAASGLAGGTEFAGGTGYGAQGGSNSGWTAAGSGSADRLLATGTHGTATITSAMPLGRTAGDVDHAADASTRNDAMWVFTLQVQLAGEPPFPAVFNYRVPADKLARVVPGARLAVAVNPANRNQEGAIDWTRSPLANPG